MALDYRPVSPNLGMDIHIHSTQRLAADRTQIRYQMMIPLDLNAVANNLPFFNMSARATHVFRF